LKKLQREQELPRAIGMCAYLQILILKDNRISTFPQSTKQMVSPPSPFQVASGSEILQFHLRFLDTCPDALLLGVLCLLELKENRIPTFPQSTKQMVFPRSLFAQC
jgi:hypothetical protein